MDTQIGAAVPLYTEDTPEGSLFFLFYDAEGRALIGVWQGH